MAKANLQQLTEMLEEKSQSSESIQQERLQNIAGATSMEDVTEVKGSIMNLHVPPVAAQELQSSLASLKREKDETELILGQRDRDLIETRKEVNNVIDKKKRLELVSN